VKDGRNAGADQELVNGHLPGGAVFHEAVAAVDVLATPFVIRYRLHAPATLLVCASDQVMDENYYPGHSLGCIR
jgi:hypothetical protein